MSSVLCQSCGSDQVRQLTPIVTYMNYYRCAACGDVWTVLLNDPEHTRHSVIMRPDREKPSARKTGS